MVQFVKIRTSIIGHLFKEVVVPTCLNIGTILDTSFNPKIMNGFKLCT